MEANRENIAKYENINVLEPLKMFDCLFKLKAMKEQIVAHLKQVKHILM